MIPTQSLTSPADWPDLAWNDTLPGPRELVLQVQRMCQEGETDPVAVMLSRYPELNADRTLVLDLIVEEYLNCKKAGKIDADGFCRRYPAFERSLRSFIIGHSFMEGKLDQARADPDVPCFQPGQHVLGFYVLRELGRGAFAQVLLATEPALGNRLVAVKVSSQGTAEARMLGRINHPNIVPVHSVQEDPSSGRFVVCMPYLGTATLDDVIDRLHCGTDLPEQARVILESVLNPISARYPPSRRETPARIFRRATYIDGILHMAVQLAEALAFIHARGICHRDLKPSNVLITPDGRPMLLDFNLAVHKRLSRGQVAGTPTYMPPEQLLALDPDNRSDLPCLIDERSDLYSLGVILYELLTGVHPFEPLPLDLSARELLSLLLAKQKRGIRPIRQLNPRVDKALAQTVERCLANDPKHRPQSAAELAAALRQHFSPLNRARRWAVLHAISLLAATIVGLTALSAGAYFLIPSEPYAIRQLHKGLDRYQRGQYEASIQYLNQAIEADPQSVEARFARARVFQHLGRIESALADYETADELANQQDGRIKACMGYCASLHGNHEKAILHYHQAIELPFSSAEVFNNLGYGYLNRRPELRADINLDEAQHWLDEAIKLNDRLQAAYYNRAILDIQRRAANTQRIPEQGLRDIHKAIELGPLTAPLFQYAARLSALTSKNELSSVPQTLDYLEKAIDLGLPPETVAADFLFHDLKSNPRFKALLKKPPSPDGFQDAVRLVDPIID
jgi:serine/threonine protein kinase/Flp pilus assembly protein TadD